MTEYQPLDYRLRCHTKRTDLPPDVLRDIGEAYEYMQLLRDELTERIHMCDMRSEKILELTAERDEARREICQLKGTVRWNPHFPFATPQQYAEVRDWDCFKQEK